MRQKQGILLLILLLTVVGTSACNSRSSSGQAASTDTLQSKAAVSSSDTLPQGEVIVMTKSLFIEHVFDYEKSSEWKYKGELPAIIDLYADWCGPCRRVAPIMQELAREYAGRIIIYKVNVDKERELAALFQANSIPTFVFIPKDELPQLMQGATTKENYKQAIEAFLLKQDNKQY
ncbi:MAG: thioredoxin family protein [Bacteroides sp.]